MENAAPGRGRLKDPNTAARCAAARELALALVAKLGSRPAVVAALAERGVTITVHAIRAWRRAESAPRPRVLAACRSILDELDGIPPA